MPNPHRYARSIRLAAVLALTAFGAPSVRAQEDAPPVPEVRETYLQLCSGCHGADARGTQQGPGLIAGPGSGVPSTRRIRRVIERGVPASGMPAFDLPENMLDALTEMVAALNGSAAETDVPGDPEAGHAFFAGQGRCSSCHTVFGEGIAIGPDLSDVANNRTVDELRQSLLEPSAEIATGYQLVDLELADGSALRGFARSRTSFNLNVQDLDGRLHPLSSDEIDRITEQGSSLMSPLDASPDDLQDLLAYLSSLTGVTPETPAASNSPAQDGITFSDLLAPKAGEWLTYNGNLSGNRYSRLDQINRSNVADLTLQWTYSIPLWRRFLPDTRYYHENMRYFGLETVPIVSDGIMYITGPNQAFALDATTGHQIWHYTRPRTEGLVSDPSLGTNRGVALLGDKVFMVTDNAHLIALNRTTGKLVWETVMPHEPQRYGGTIAPLIVKDMVIAGVAGGDWGIRGFLAAYNVHTGEEVWRHWTIPAEGEPGSETWEGTSMALGGGSTWLTGSYDEATDTLFWATGNPWPNSDDSQRGGDNLYTDSVLALDPADGKLKWYFQFTPHDIYDWDANEPNVLVDAVYRGEPRKLLLHADRNGFFYVFDRTDGELLLAETFLDRLTWASGIDENGRPVRLPPSDLRCPNHATNWNGSSYSPDTGLYYIIADEKCRVTMQPGGWKRERPKADPGTRYIRALNIETGEVAWETPRLGPIDGKRGAGILGTAGGILFYGDPSGYFLAVDERDGKTLWKLPLNATIKTSPMTYSVDGKQYVSLAVGSNIMTFGLPD